MWVWFISFYWQPKISLDCPFNEPRSAPVKQKQRKWVLECSLSTLFYYSWISYNCVPLLVSSKCSFPLYCTAIKSKQFRRLSRKFNYKYVRTYTMWGGLINFFFFSNFDVPQVEQKLHFKKSFDFGQKSQGSRSFSSYFI